MTITMPNSQACSGLEYTKKYVKSMLRNCVFVGDFKEKRFVDRINAYRDVITISADENDFIQNLIAVKRKLDVEVVKKSWVGITTPTMIGAPVGYNLWVVLSQEVVGTYWYRVKTVEFLSDEIRLKLDIVRPYQKESTPLKASEKAEVSLISVYHEKKKIMKENLVYFLKHILTQENIKEMYIYLSVLVSAVYLKLENMVKYLLEYLLLLIHEISNFIDSITPIINGMFQMVTKCILGLYHLLDHLLAHLIHLFFRKPTPVYNNYINFDPRNDPRARYNKYSNANVLPYSTSQRRRLTITPLD